MYFGTKSYLKSTRNHTANHALRGRCRAAKRAYSRHPYALPRTNLKGTNCVLEEREKERMSSDYNIIGIILKILTK
jgi:hypothetical protein